MENVKSTICTNYANNNILKKNDLIRFLIPHLIYSILTPNLQLTIKPLWNASAQLNSCN